MGCNGILLKAGMRSGNLKWEIENDKFIFSSLFCGFGFTFYIEDEIFFIDYHVFFQKLSGAKFRK